MGESPRKEPGRRGRLKWLPVFSIILVPVLFLLSGYAFGFRVEAIQPNGLPRIDYPYYGYGYLASGAAAALLIFAVVLAAAELRGKTGSPARPVLGGGLMSVGLVVSFFAAFIFLASLSDEGPRCLGGCAPSALRYYQIVEATSFIILALGLVAACYGGWLIVRRGKSGFFASHHPES